MKAPAKELLVFDSAYDFYKTLGLPVDALDPKSEFTILNLGDYPIPAGYKSPSYRCNFFSFVFFKDAYGTCSFEGEFFDTTPGTTYFNNPGHLKQFTVNYAKQLYLITLSESFLKENVHREIFREFPFLLSENVSPTVLAPQDYAEFEEFYLQIQKAFVSTSPYKNKLIGHLFVALLIKIKEKFWPDYNPIKEGDRSSEIVKRFKILLEKHYRDLSEGLYERMHRVTEYADLLNLHPNYLNTVIRVKTGKSVGNWISEKTIAEAKAMLKNSDLSVKEISYRLGFAEIQHFSTYFKKHTKLTPVLYRQDA